jgi:hypothetical protein
VVDETMRPERHTKNTKGKAASSGYIFPKIIPEAQSRRKSDFFNGFVESSEGCRISPRTNYLGWPRVGEGLDLLAGESGLGI